MTKSSDLKNKTYIVYLALREIRFLQEKWVEILSPKFNSLLWLKRWLKCITKFSGNDLQKHGLKDIVQNVLNDIENDEGNFFRDVLMSLLYIKISIIL